MSTRVNTAESTVSDSGHFRSEPVGESIAPTSGVVKKEKPADWYNVLTVGPRASLPSTSAIHVILLVALRIVFGLFSRMRVKGSRVLPRGAKLFVVDSARLLGGAFIVSSLPLWASRDVYVLANEGQRLGRFSRFLAERVRVIVPNEEFGFQGSLRAVAVALRAGRSVVVFREAQAPVSSAPPVSSAGSLAVSPQDFEKRYEALAQHVGVPLIPVELQGVGSFLPEGALLPRLGGRVNVTFLEAVMPDRERS